MDEHEGISRRDALIGVSFLTVLTTAFMATMAYRIVESQPRKGPARTQAIASLPSEALESPASEELPQVDGNVQTASAVEPVETTAPERNIPHFVAPSER